MKETNNNIALRDVEEDDLPIFFEHHRDPPANDMAAFTHQDPSDRDAFMAHWRKMLKDDTVAIRTVLFDGQVAGSVASYVDPQMPGPEVTYWIGRDFWGRGIATTALSMFLAIQTHRPIYARAAADNAASRRVLAKCEFELTGYDQAYANARGKEIEEAVFILR